MSLLIIPGKIVNRVLSKVWCIQYYNRRHVTWRLAKTSFNTSMYLKKKIPAYFLRAIDVQYIQCVLILLWKYFYIDVNSIFLYTFFFLFPQLHFVFRGLVKGRGRAIEIRLQVRKRSKRTSMLVEVNVLWMRKRKEKKSAFLNTSARSSLL